MKPLFRKEAIDAIKTFSWGRVLRANGVSSRTLFLLALAIFLTSLAVGLIGEYSRKETIQGLLMPSKGLVEVAAPVRGHIDSVNAREGIFLELGQPVLIIESPQLVSGRTDSRGEQIRLLNETRQLLTAQIGRMKATFDETSASLRDQISHTNLSIKSINTEEGIERLRQTNAEATVSAYQAQEKAGFISRLLVLPKEDVVLQGRARLSSLYRELEAKRIEARKLKQEISQLPERYSVEVEGARRLVAQIDQQIVDLMARKSLSLAAPVSGRVIGLLANPGQQVAEGDLLLTMIPAGSELQAHLFAPSAKIGGIRVGQRVVVRYKTYPYQVYGHQSGTVKELSGPVIPPRVFSQETVREPVFRVVVSLDSQEFTSKNKHYPLQPAMALEGDIFLERRSLLAWLFDPLLRILTRELAK